MAETPDVLKRLEEIEALHAHACSPGCDTGWLLRLTRALLASQGELAERVMLYHDARVQFRVPYTAPSGVPGHHEEQCRICVMLARADGIRKGELP